MVLPFLFSVMITCVNLRFYLQEVLMKLVLSAILGLLLIQVSAKADSVTREKMQKVRSLEVKLDHLYDKLQSKTQEILPPFKKLDVSQMSVQELVEVQKILAPFYALDRKLAAYPSQLKSSVADKKLTQVEKELGFLEQVIKNL